MVDFKIGFWNEEPPLCMGSYTFDKRFKCVPAPIAIVFMMEERFKVERKTARRVLV